MRRYALRDDQWDRIRDLLPGREGTVGVTARDNRLFVEAVLYRYRTGMPWRDLPERFGDGVQVHRRFSRWAKSGAWERVFQYLAVDADNEHAMIDSTIVRAHQHSAGAKKRRRGRGDRTIAWRTEYTIHTMVDALGNPVGFFLTGGQAHDLEGADHFLPSMQADTSIADKVFDADARVIAPLEAAGKATVIRSKANRQSPHEFDTEINKERHLIENFFAKLKQFRAVATRYEKTKRNFLAAIHLVAAVIWLN